MNVEKIALLLPFLVLTIGGLYQLVRYRTLRGAEIGSRILATIGEVEFGQQLMAGSKIRVLQLKGADGDAPTIGVDSVVPFLAPNRLTPFSLTKEQARSLGALLSEAGKA